MPHRDPAAHRAYHRAYQRKYRAAYPEREAAYKAVSRPRYRAKALAYAKAYREVHREQMRERQAAHRLANLEFYRARGVENMYRRRALARGNGGSHTTQEWLEKCALLGNVCFYCGEARFLTRDHKVPLIRGGSNDIENIVPACVSCNCRKNRKTSREFLGIEVLAA